MRARWGAGGLHCHLLIESRRPVGGGGGGGEGWPPPHVPPTSRDGGGGRPGRRRRRRRRPPGAAGWWRFAPSAPSCPASLGLGLGLGQAGQGGSRGPGGRGRGWAGGTCRHALREAGGGGRDRRGRCPAPRRARCAGGAASSPPPPSSSPGGANAPVYARADERLGGMRERERGREGWAVDLHPPPSGRGRLFCSQTKQNVSERKAGALSRPCSFSLVPLSRRPPSLSFCMLRTAASRLASRLGGGCGGGLATADMACCSGACSTASSARGYATEQTKNGEQKKRRLEKGPAQPGRARRCARRPAHLPPQVPRACSYVCPSARGRERVGWWLPRERTRRHPLTPACRHPPRLRRSLRCGATFSLTHMPRAVPPPHPTPHPHRRRQGRPPRLLPAGGAQGHGVR